MLVVEGAKALVLKLNNPRRVLDTIPTARPFRDGAVVVPHRLDEVRVLRNLGFDAPSPIAHYYDWPGQFTPYEHQRNTAAFLTVHPKALVLNSIGCVDADTEYLSPTGWVRIADYAGGPVAQYWPHTRSIDFVTSPEFVKLPCTDMVRIKTKHGVDQLLSPEHRVLLHSRSDNDAQETVSAEELLRRHDLWVGGVRETTRRGRIGYARAGIPTVFKTQGGQGLPLTDAQLRVMVATMADGHFPNGANTCCMRLKKDRKKQRLVELLSAAGIPYTVRPCLPEGFHLFKYEAPQRLKVYDSSYWAATAAQLAIIADEAPRWDGSYRKSGKRVEFFSSVKASADFVQYAMASCGYTARVLTYTRGDESVEYITTASLARRGSVGLSGVGVEGRKASMQRQRSTDGFKYCFMVPSTYLVLRRGGCIFATGNTGKTVSALWAADYLMRAGAVRKVLIVSPLSTLERVWGDAIFANLVGRTSVTLHGNAQRRWQLLTQNADYYIVNHDGFGVIGERCHGMFDLVIFDEAAVLRNPGTKRFKLFYRWMQKNPNTRLWLMTGTPTPNEPTDAWTLARLVDNPIVPKTHGAFRDIVMIKAGPYRWIPHPHSTDHVAQILQPSVRYTREECLDLPDTIVQTRTVELTPDQKKHYTTMMRHLVTETAAGGETITAVNAAVKLQKLVQIACGVAYSDDGGHVEIDCTPRVNLVKELIQEAGEKVIVFVPLTGTLRMLERELSKHWSVGVVNGSVASGQRNEIFSNFQRGKDPHVLIAHPATMAHGLTLTAASTIIWYGPVTSNEQYTQANGRVERIGKRSVSNVVHIEATELERKMYARLSSKQELQDLLLDIIKGERNAL